MTRLQNDSQITAVQKSGWPQEDLEQVETCPACGSKNRSILYSSLTDRVFHTAPGNWSLYRCKACNSAHLDPRPTIESIGKAYTEYYTHEAPVVVDRSLVIPFGRLRLALRNGYLNLRYGYKLKPSAWFGFFLAYLYPTQKVKEDRLVRHLRLPRRGPYLLDIGCGNGFFLKRMQAAGWVVEGIDPDPKAVQCARDLHIPVQQGNLSDGVYADETFDAVTLNHVIEHLHDPLSALSFCYRILRPRGILWIGTPNLDAYGHRLFGKDWRGLEPPRHLCLFNHHSLRDMIEKAGFEFLSSPLGDLNSEWMYRASLAVARGSRPFDNPPILPAALQKAARLADLKTLIHPNRAEELVIIARKPGI